MYMYMFMYMFGSGSPCMGQRLANPFFQSFIAAGLFSRKLLGNCDFRDFGLKL